MFVICLPRCQNLEKHRSVTSNIWWYCFVYIQRRICKWVHKQKLPIHPSQPTRGKLVGYRALARPQPDKLVLRFSHNQNFQALICVIRALNYTLITLAYDGFLHILRFSYFETLICNNSVVENLWKTSLIFYGTESYQETMVSGN